MYYSNTFAVLLLGTSIHYGDSIKTPNLSLESTNNSNKALASS
jgi:hypothetical protein